MKKRKAIQLIVLCVFFFDTNLGSDGGGFGRVGEAGQPGKPLDG